MIMSRYLRYYFDFDFGWHLQCDFVEDGLYFDFDFGWHLHHDFVGDELYFAFRVAEKLFEYAQIQIIWYKETCIAFLVRKYKVIICRDGAFNAKEKIIPWINFAINWILRCCYLLINWLLYYLLYYAVFSKSELKKQEN